MTESVIKTSEQTGELSKALVAAQAKMPISVKADATNPHFRSKYASLAAVNAAVFPIFHDHDIGLFFSQSNGTMTCRLLHGSGQWMEVTIPSVLRDAANPQVVGSATTYGRRYLTGMVSGVATEVDDDGNAAAQPSAAETQTSEPPRDWPDVPPTEGEELWPIGKYKGTPLSQVPVDYLVWAKNNLDPGRGRAYHLAEVEIEKRGEEAPPMDDEVPF